MVGMVKGERGFSKPPVVAIPAAALREAGSAADSVWKQLCDQHNKRARQKQVEFDAMVENGTFTAILARKPKEKGTTAQPKQKRQRKTPSGAELSMVGAGFVGEGTVWQVLKVQFEKLDEVDDQLVVYYYDKAAVESEDIDEAELGDDHEYVEWSTVDEARQWIKDSGRSVV